jgi:hypothetical protein
MDDDAEGHWLSYAELAELRGITRKAAIRLTQRHHWRRQPGNDGATKVLVPAGAMASREERRQTPRHDDPPTSFQTEALAVLETAVTTLTEQLAKAEGRLSQAEERAANLETANRSQAAALEDARERADRAYAEATEARQQAEALEAEERARQARGRWARLRAAWWGE